MGRLCETEAGLTDEQQAILRLVRKFIDEHVVPVASALEHRDENPADIVEALNELGTSKEYEIEPLHREALMLLIGEGTSEIQRMIIGRRVLENYPLTS